MTLHLCMFVCLHATFLLNMGRMAERLFSHRRLLTSPFSYQCKNKQIKHSIWWTSSWLSELQSDRHFILYNEVQLIYLWLFIILLLDSCRHVSCQNVMKLAHLGASFCILWPIYCKSHMGFYLLNILQCTVSKVFKLGPLCSFLLY